MKARQRREAAILEVPSIVELRDWRPAELRRAVGTFAAAAEQSPGAMAWERSSWPALGATPRQAERPVEHVPSLD